MNAGIVTSTIIGGIFLILIMTFNERVSTNSNETTLNNIVKGKISDVREILSYDFRRIGYEVNNSKLLQANENKITFKEEYSGNIHTVSWFFDDSQADTDSKNPNDHPLYRIEDGVKNKINASVVTFKLEYRLKNGNITSNPSASDVKNIRGISVQLVLESPQKYGKIYQVAAWQKTFTPANLQF